MAIRVIVNGIEVYTNKEVVLVQDNRIHFTDRSYVDVITKEIVNRGEGFIAFEPNAIVLEGAECQKITEKFCGDGSAVTIENVTADIRVWQTSTLLSEIDITGTKDCLEQITITEKPEAISICGKNPDQANRITVVKTQDPYPTGAKRMIMASASVFGKSVFISTDEAAEKITGREITITQSRDPALTIDITVPDETDLTFSGINGIIEIQGVAGNVGFSNSGSSSLYATSVKRFRANLYDDECVTVDHVSGDVSLRVGGTSSIEIKDGKIGELDICAEGKGVIVVQATAESADITASDDRDIYVQHVATKPRKRQSGASIIHVGYIG